MPPKRKKNIMLAFKINEISGVDVPAQEGALALIMKRADKSVHPIDDDGKKKKKKDKDDIEGISKLSALTDGTNGHSHTIALLGPPDGVQLVSGDTSFADGHTHPWVMMGGGEIRIGAAKDSTGLGHFHAIEAMSKNQITGTPGHVIGKTEDPTMSDKKTPTVEELQADLVKAQKMASLNDAEKVYHKAMDDKGASAFLDMSSDDRAKVVKAAADAVKKQAESEDPVVYTTADGVEIHKSAGAAVIAMAKSNDDLIKRLDKSDTALKQNALEKRVGDLFPNLPGTIEERAAILKAVDGIDDEKHRDVAMANLKSQNKILGKAITTLGYLGGTTVVETTGPSGDLDVLVKKYHADHAADDISIEMAYSKVLETPEGADLYAKSLN